jgi:hypothetical protein
MKQRAESHEGINRNSRILSPESPEPHVFCLHFQALPVKSASATIDHCFDLPFCRFDRTTTANGTRDSNQLARVFLPG